MLGEQCKQVFEEAPYSVVLHQVVAQDARGLVEIAIPAAAGHKMLDQNGYRWIQSYEATPKTPVDRVEVRVDLPQAGCRPGILTDPHG